MFINPLMGLKILRSCSKINWLRKKWHQGSHCHDIFLKKAVSITSFLWYIYKILSHDLTEVGLEGFFLRIGAVQMLENPQRNIFGVVYFEWSQKPSVCYFVKSTLCFGCFPGNLTQFAKHLTSDKSDKSDFRQICFEPRIFNITFLIYFIVRHLYISRLSVIETNKSTFFGNYALDAYQYDASLYNLSFLCNNNIHKKFMITNYRR